MFSQTLLVELRKFLKEFVASTTDEAQKEKIDVINGLIPAMVDAMTDEELTEMMGQMWSFVMTNLVTSAVEKAVSEADPSLEAAAQ